MPQRELRNNDVTEAVLQRNAATIYRIAYLRTGNTHDAEDIMQDVFVRYIKNAPCFDSTEHEKAWFIRTTVNRTKSFFTSAWMRRTVPLEDDITVYDEYDENTLLDEVMKLPKDISTAIHLYYYEDMSVKEICDAIGKSESAVKSLLFRGRKLLKISLTDSTDDMKG